MEFLKGVYQLVKIIVVWGFTFLFAPPRGGSVGDMGAVKLNDSTIHVKEVRMQMPVVLQKLLSSRRVWLALVSFVVTVLGVVYPQIPPTIVQSANTLALVLIGVITLDDTIATLKG